MILSALLLAATIATKADVPRLTPAELAPLIESGDAVVIDVRGSVPYKLGRIAGATWVPLGKVSELAASLPKEKLLVAYCTCGAEELSLEAAMVLAQKHGFERVAVLKGGYPAWKDAGLPVQSDRAPEEQPAVEGGGGAGRMRPPDSVKCDRNQLTAYIGRVTEYRREKDTTILIIATSSDTVETVTLRGDPKNSYLIQGKPFDEERAEKVVRPGVSAVAWVCADGTTIVDWRPGTTFTGAE
jgi:rhodanese-related sulfurtransferase